MKLEVPDIFVRFKPNLCFSTDLRKRPQYKIHKNPSSGSREDTPGHTDGRTDMTKLLGASRDYENVPKKHTV